jgi:Holliday junction resolvasome RuvABC endonuclease subunit
MALIDLFAKRFISIDNSTNSTSYALWEGSKLIEFGEIVFKGKDTYERLVTIHDALAELREKCVGINDLYIESSAMVNNRKVVILMALAEGAAISAIAHPGMKIHRVSALVWQKAIGNKPWTKAQKDKLKKDNPGKTAGWYKTEERKQRKQYTMDLVEKEFGVKVENDNQSDSLGLGLYIARTK